MTPQWSSYSESPSQSSSEGHGTSRAVGSQEAGATPGSPETLTVHMPLFSHDQWELKFHLTAL